LPAPPDLSPYALKSEIPTVPAALDLTPFALKSEIPAIPAPPDLSAYALKSEIPTVPAAPDLSGYALRSEIPAMPDLSVYALKAETAMVQPKRDEGPDDLKEIWGVGPVLEKRLHANGIYRFRQVALWRDSDIDEIEPRLDSVPDRVRRENWMAHARQLHFDKYGEWLAEYEGRGPANPDAIPAVAETPIPKGDAPKARTRGGDRDDLKLIHGVGPVLEKRLHELGVTSFEQIAKWTEEDIDAIEPKLESVPNRIRREGWVEHAAALMKDLDAPPPYTDRQ
jgi:predicted flap endonuclease-1-like 5' DNA nuclease